MNEMLVPGYRWGPLAVAVVMLFAVGASAQSAEKAEPVWQKICTDDKNPKTCRISQQLFLTKEVDGKQETVGLVLGLGVLYAADPETEKRALHMTFRMPLGVDLRPDAVMRIDKGPETRLTYLQCTNAGCDASLPLGAELLKALKAGNTISTGFRPWGQVEVTVIKASLKGFTRAFRGIK